MAYLSDKEMKLLIEALDNLLLDLVINRVKTKSNFHDDKIDCLTKIIVKLQDNK